MGLSADEASRLGPDAAVRIRIFRLILAIAQRMRTVMDQRLRPDGLTTQQAALITIVDACGTPSLTQVARFMGTTHQNARQIADALERKGFLRIVADERDARVRRLHTTERSHAYWQRRSDADQQHVLTWFAEMADQDAAHLFELLMQLYGSLSITGGTEGGHDFST
jgi:DNA-binding MarR family transcriptional regulator